MDQQFEHIQSLIELRDIRKAEAAIAHLLRSNPSSEEQMELLSYRARTRLIASRVDDALHDLSEIRTVDPQRFEQSEMMALLADCHLARFELATVGFSEKEDVRIAQDLYQQIIERFPEYDDLGWVYYQQGRAALIADQAFVAESAFHKALFNPSHVVALTAYCYERLSFIAFYEARQPKQALTYLKKALDTYPTSASPLWLVQAYLLQSRVLKDIDPVLAIESAKQALQIASDDAQSKSLIAETAFVLAELLTRQSGHEIEIINYLQKFMQHSKAPLGVDVTWSRMYQMLGDAYFATKHYDQAINAYENVLQCNPDHPWEETIHYQIGRSYYQQEDYELVVRILEPLLTEDKSVQDYRIYDLFGNALFAMGQYARAIEAYTLAIDLAPPNVDIQRMQAYHTLSQRMDSPL